MQDTAVTLRNRLRRWEKVRGLKDDPKVWDEYVEAKMDLDRHHQDLVTRYQTECRSMHNIDKPCELRYQAANREFLDRQPMIQCATGISTPFPRSSKSAGGRLASAWDELCPVQ